MTSGTSFEFDARNHTVVVLPVLRATLVLPLARVALLKLLEQGAKIVLPNCACHFAQMGPDLYSKCSCPRIICNFGTATSQLPLSNLVLNGDCAVQQSEVAKL